MNDGKHSFDKLIHVQNLLQVFLAQLCDLQHTESQKVVPNLTGVKLQIHNFSLITNDRTETQLSIVLDQYYYSEIFDQCN